MKHLIRSLIVRLFFGKPITGEKIDYSKGQKTHTTMPEKKLDFNEWAEKICKLNNQK